MIAALTLITLLLCVLMASKGVESGSGPSIVVVVAV